ncbi:AraC family transcriptional regulator [Lysinibacillus contaminans]|uniref:AraC family transcriptional regulator n=1 Tax=Lysinibacillus contaminans TaxID=1293441 RepID=A0ABR5JZS3_9BACI|nr:AraC family transcriptional regulator [Lysinibacillus contaminans]
MALTYIKLAKDLQELTSHGSKSFPVALYETVLRLDRTDFLPLHWHKEIQFVYVKTGRILYRVGHESFVLEAGEGLFVNAGRFHEGKPFEVDEAIFYCINVDPSMLAGHEESIIATQFVLPYVIEGRRSFVKLSDDVACEIEAVAKLLKERKQFYELKVWRGLLHIWESLLEQSALMEEQLSISNIVQHERVKQMIDYLHTHFMEKVLLDELAAHVFLSRAECSRFFKKMVGMTVFEYLLHYRLQKSMELLRNKELSITEIAVETGFSTVSFYIEKFKGYTGYTPYAYRKAFL